MRSEDPYVVNVLQGFDRLVSGLPGDVKYFLIPYSEAIIICMFRMPDFLPYILGAGVSGATIVLLATRFRSGANFSEEE